MPAELVEELSWRGGAESGPTEVAGPELDGVARVLAALEMRMLSLETREGGEGGAGPALASLKEHLSEVAGRLDVQDQKTDVVGAASTSLRETVQALRARIEQMENRDVREVQDLRSRVAEVDKGLREARTSSDELVRSLDETLRRSVEAIEQRSTRTESSLGGRLVDLKNALEFGESERAAALTALGESLERLRRGVTNVQTRLSGVEERGAKTEAAAGRHEELQAELVEAKKALARLEEEQHKHLVEAERVEAARIEEVKARLAELQQGFQRIEQQAAGSQQQVAETRQQAARVETLRESMQRLEGSISDVAAGLRRLEEMALAPPAPAPVAAPPAAPPPAPAWHIWAMGLGGAVAGALVVHFVPGGGKPQEPPLQVAASALMPPPQAPLPPPEMPRVMPEPPREPAPTAPPPMAEPVASSPQPIEPSVPAEPAAPPAPPAPVQPIVAAEPQAPPARHRKRRRPPRELPPPAVTAQPETANAAVQLMDAKVSAEGVMLTWTRNTEPEITLKQDPPRMLLEFPNAKSLLPSEDIGGFPPHILAVRATNETRNRVWVEILLDEPASYKLVRDKSTLTLQVPYEFKF